MGAIHLTAEQSEVAIDILQLTLDLAGIVDPTPRSDGASALVSIARGVWMGQGSEWLACSPI